MAVAMAVATAEGLEAAAAAAPARAPLAASRVPVEIAVRSTDSGAPLAAQVRLIAVGSGGVETVQFADVHGTTLLRLPGGEWEVEVRAPGHRPLTARLVVGPEAPRSWSFELESLVEDGRDTLPEALPGEALLAGMVRASESGEPLAGVRIAVVGGASTESDEAGRYQLAIPAREASGTGPAELPTISLTASFAGRTTRSLEGILAVEGTQFHRWTLTPGSGVESAIDAHRLHAKRGGVGEGADPEAGEAPGAPAGLVLPPPPSVRVGFADAACSTPCCTTSCTAVCVLPLETYVARGLNDEWISSWGFDSLASGAIAYRSYAAYRVDHPIRPSFDLCSSACCQVNDPDTSSATSAAVAATSGLLLERNGAAFQAEYSAENNSWDDPNDGRTCSNADLSCGDGAVGSPALGWPCLADSVALGEGCFGHGRGLSQWGSQRWSLDGATWKWILDHYYNASGNPGGLRSAWLASPAEAGAGRLCPAAAGPGDRIALHLAPYLHAAAALPGVLFGASVRAPGGAWQSDPAHDSPVALAPGANLATREFDLPAGAAAGLWDVALALWLDVDADGAITAADLPLDSRLLSDLLAVDPQVDLLFADCFESGDTGRW
jgi:hypothetical protein